LTLPSRDLREHHQTLDDPPGSSDGAALFGFTDLTTIPVLQQPPTLLWLGQSRPEPHTWYSRVTRPMAMTSADFTGSLDNLLVLLN
jgi:hypothetical protein